MQTTKRDGSEERRILIGMIVDKQVLGQVSSKWETGLFKSSWSNLIGDWCCDYFNEYEDAPKQEIESLFESWASGNVDEDTSGLVERFLSDLSDEYEELSNSSNSAYIVDLAAKHFNKVKLKKLASSITGDITGGELDKALKRVNDYGQIEIGVGSGIDPLNDTEAIQAAFEEQQEPLVTYPSALGDFFSGALQRDAFIAFMGAEKRGKTWWLLDVAWRAMCQRRKVALFEVGDMSQNQIMRRLMTRAARQPLRKQEYQYPIAMEKEHGAPMAAVNLETRKTDKDMGWQTAWKACQKVVKSKIKSKETMLKLSCHPNSTLNVSGIRSILQGWERGGWVPDVIVIDYADILAPPLGSGNADTRDQINATWKQLRALSQSHHCLVVTATQADANSYNANTIGRSNFSEDKRKFAHVTGMVGLNANSDEKEFGIMRLNWIVLRESAFTETHCVHVAGCLAVGNPAVRSTF
jgi:replicative DNA helicase